MANSDTDLDAVKKDLSQLRDDVKALTESLQASAKGHAADAGARVRERVDQGKDQVMAVEKQAEAKIAEHPLQSVGIAFGIGFLIGRLAGR